MSKTSRIHAVITIHGMGEPRPNSTLMPVAERLAAASCHGVDAIYGETLTLGMLSGRTGNLAVTDAGFAPALQLKGVRIKPYPDTYRRPVFPVPGIWEDQDLYFADMFWSPVTDDAFKLNGQDLSSWTGSLINRLYRKQISIEGETRKTGAWWVVDFLTTLRQTLVMTEKLMLFRAKEVHDLIFGKYLGDVQLYGEDATVRGKAVKIFHETMAGIHRQLSAKHPDAEIEYTLLAHSLGTVLTFDALISAMARPELLAGPASGDPGLLPFPGYHQAGKTLPDLTWSRHVRAMVTLGSPIDKFLTLWWYNYEYLNRPEDWIRDDVRKVRHFNFCDEQDPVGHNLDLARTAAAYRKVFSDDPRGGNDLLYNHTPYAGYAHVDYWKDQDLFDLIYKRVIVPEGKPEDITREDRKKFPMGTKRIHGWIVALHFFLFPLLLAILCHATVLGVLSAKSWHSAALWTAGFLGSLWLTRELLVLNLTWRQLLKQKRRLSATGKKKAGESYPSSLNFIWRGCAIICGLVSLCAVSAMIQKGGEWKEFQAGIIGVTSVALLLVVWPLTKLFPRRKPSQTSRPPAFSPITVGEILWLALAFIPTLLGLFQLYCPLPIEFPGLAEMRFGVLLFMAPLFQIFALVLTELSWQHYRVKKRLGEGDLRIGSQYGALEKKAEGAAAFTIQGEEEKELMGFGQYAQ